MATKIMEYTTDLGEVFGVTVDDTLYNALDSIDGGQFDSAGAGIQVVMHADLAAFNAANADAGLLPARINPRTLTLRHPMGDKTLVVPGAFDPTKLEITEQESDFGAGELEIIRLQGEAQNDPAIEAT